MFLIPKESMNNKNVETVKFEMILPAIVDQALHQFDDNSLKFWASKHLNLTLRWCKTICGNVFRDQNFFSVLFVKEPTATPTIIEPFNFRSWAVTCFIKEK